MALPLIVDGRLFEETASTVLLIEMISHEWQDSSRDIAPQSYFHTSFRKFPFLSRPDQTGRDPSNRAWILQRSGH
jgi:hypothetical protein